MAKIKDEYDIVILGAGAAGLMAAITAGRNGASVCLIEKNEKPGKKIYITGKGRCNVTNACDTEELFSHMVSNEKFMYSSFYGFSNWDTIDFFETLGMPTKTERGNRVFPVSDKSSDVIRALWDECKRCSVDLLFYTEVEDICVRDGVATGVVLAGDRKQIRGKNIIVATGGKSYQSTGSTGDGYEFAKRCGHTVKPCVPGLVPMNTVEQTPMKMQGLSMKNVELTYYLVTGTKKKKIYQEFGEMMFTHFGITGPVVLSASSYIGDYLQKGTVVAELDCKPALDKDKLHRRILRDFEASPNASLKNTLGALLPKSMIPVLLQMIHMDGMRAVNTITKEERETMVATIKAMPFTIASLRGWNEAIITRGGVCVKEINPSTMESKCVKNLYFAGEVLDLDAVTGGFNLQIAWSTGHLAAQSACEK